MEFLSALIEAYLNYLNELWFAVLIGFLISGFINEFLPTDIIQHHLGEEGLRPILISSFIGMILPVCCFGSLPIAMTLRKKGARLGPVLAFLVATPATSISALIVSWKLLGTIFTVYIFFAVLVMGIVIGLIGNRLRYHIGKESSGGAECCHDDCEERKGCHKTILDRVKLAFLYAFVTLPKEIGLELLIGVAIASIILVFEPLQHLIDSFLSGGFGYAFSLFFGLGTYVCSTASVPMADAFLKSGMNSGAGMVYLLVGPITSYGALIVLKKTFGFKILGVYLLVICFMSLLLGAAFNCLISSSLF